MQPQLKWAISKCTNVLHIQTFFSLNDFDNDIKQKRHPHDATITISLVDRLTEGQLAPPVVYIGTYIL